MIEKKGISVIIPNYNGIELLGEIIPPLYKALWFANHSYEIIVCDDFSTDHSVSFIKNNYPEITIIESKRNAGFSPTINKGIFAAQYDFVFLLNNDVKVNEDYFLPLFRYFEREDTFGVMGQIIGWENQSLLDTSKYPSSHFYKVKTNINYIKKKPQQNDWLFSIYLSGANAFVDRKKLMHLQGFNEIFAPFYMEDYEMSIRAWRLGWKCYYEHFSICRHKTSVTIKSQNKKRKIQSIYYRNKFYFHFLHLSKAQYYFWFFQNLLETLIQLSLGKLYFLSSWKMFFREKKRLNALKKDFLYLQKVTLGYAISLKDVFKIVDDSIDKNSIIKF